MARWWNHETSAQAVERDFGPAVDGIEPGEVFVAHWDGRPAGLIQRYLLDDYPDYVSELSRVLPVPAGTLGMDYLVGEPGLLRRGLATAMLARPCVPHGATTRARRR